MNRKIAFTITLLLSSVPLFGQDAIQTPNDYLKTTVGADRTLIDWKEITSYFRYAAGASDRVSVRELGKTTLGKPFIMATITSPANHARLDEIAASQKQLARPYGIDETAAAELIANTPAVFLVTLNIHSTEIAASQESVELVHELATTDDPALLDALDNVVLLLVPSLNPDGQQMVVDWYEKNAGTESEGAWMPWLYHRYAGHDNNRDWFFFNLAESRLVAEVLYHEWFPEIVLDQHQMGSSGPRLFLPPYEDPVNPNVHPLLTARMNQIGNHVMAEMTADGFSGIVNGARFNAYFQGTMSKTPLWHNRVGILSEAASTRIATPLFFPQESLRGLGSALLEYRAQGNFPNPWEGGWWRLRSIIEYEKALTFNMLKFVAERKEQFKSDYYRLNTEAVERGKAEPPFGFVIPYESQDKGAVRKMIETVQRGGVEVERLQEPLTVDGREYPAGDFYISLAQPERPYIIDLLTPLFYPNLKEYPGGPPSRPYDVTGWSLTHQFGVDIVPVNDRLDRTSLVFLEFGATDPSFSASSYTLPARNIDSYRAVIRLLTKGVPVSYAETADGEEVFLVDASTKAAAAALVEAVSGTQLEPEQANGNLKTLRRVDKLPALGIYQPWRASMDEGWTRYVLDDFGFEYRVLHNKDMKKKLAGKYDVIIIPSTSTRTITDGIKDEEPSVGSPRTPKEYTGGIGKDGVKELRKFVREGGKLITLGNSSSFAIEKLKLPVSNTLKNVSRKEFYAPGSFFNVVVNKASLLTFGMREHATVFFYNNPAFRLRSYTAESVSVLRYPVRDVLAGGWLLGEEHLSSRSAMVQIPVGEGSCVLYGFQPQHRAQTWGTFRLLFNAILN